MKNAESIKEQKHMKNMTIRTKKAILAVTLVLCTAGIAAGAAQIWVFGNGMEYGPDRGSVDSQAYNDAVTNANAVCPGVIEENNYIKTNDTCGNLGDDTNPNWMCAVSVKAICRAGR